MMTTVFQSTHVDGSPLMLPFPFGPQREDNVPVSLKNNVWWLAKGEEGALWAGYYAHFKSAKVAVELYQGVWFELQVNDEGNTLEAVHVARPALNLTHDPDRNMNIDSIQAQGTLQVSGRPLATTGFVTTPRFSSTDPPSRPASWMELP